MEEFHILASFSQKPMIKIMTGIQQKVIYPPWYAKMNVFVYFICPIASMIWNIYLHENHKKSAIHVGKPGVRTDASWWVATLIGAALCLLATPDIALRNFTVNSCSEPRIDVLELSARETQAFFQVATWRFAATGIHIQSQWALFLSGDDLPFPFPVLKGDTLLMAEIPNNHFGYIYI